MLCLSAILDGCHGNTSIVRNYISVNNHHVLAELKRQMEVIKYFWTNVIEILFLKLVFIIYYNDLPYFIWFQTIINSVQLSLLPTTSARHDRKRTKDMERMITRNQKTKKARENNINNSLTSSTWHRYLTIYIGHYIEQWNNGTIYFNK